MRGDAECDMLVIQSQRHEDTGDPDLPPVTPNLKSTTSIIAHGHLG